MEDKEFNTGADWVHQKDIPPYEVSPPDYVPVPMLSFVSKLHDSLLPHQQKDFLAVSEAVQCYFHETLRKPTQVLKRDFLYINGMYPSDAADIHDVTASGRDPESEFVFHFAKTVKRARYLPLTTEDVNRADEYNYLFNLPVQIAWDNMHDLSKHQELIRHESLFPALEAGFSKYFLIFHRGVSVDKRKELFFWLKMEILLDLWRTSVWNFLSSGVKILLGSSKEESTETVPSEKPDGKDDDGDERKPVYTLPTDDDESLTKVERINLMATFQRRTSWITWLLEESTIQEPCYERLVLIYRDSKQNVKTKATNVFEQDKKQAEAVKKFIQNTSSPKPNPSVKPTLARMTTATRHARRITSMMHAKQEVGESGVSPLQDAGPVHINFFKDVPMADLEMFYPEKSMHMSAADKFKLAASIIIGFLAVIYGFESDHAAGWTFITVVLSIIAYVIQSIFSFQSTLEQYSSLVNDALHEKTLDNDLGAIVALTDQEEEQVVNEVMLILFCLIIDGPQSEEELLRKCTRVLEVDFDIEVKFHLHWALREMVEKKIIMAQEEPRMPGIITYEAPPLPQLVQNWNKAFLSSGVK